MQQLAGDYNRGHATELPLAADVRVREPVIFDDAAGPSRGTALNAHDINTFREQGFLVKRGLLGTSGSLATAVDYVWRNVPRAIIRRDDPDSWLASPHRLWTEADAIAVGMLSSGNWKMRSRGPAGIGTEQFLLDGLANHPDAVAVVRALIGPPVQPVRRVRGIYSILPKPPALAGRYGPHVDNMAAHLSAMILVDDIPPHCGGFMVWPGSHRHMHPHWDTVHGSNIGPVRADGFKQARDDVIRGITPVEFTGHAGDVIFWHPRCVHSAGINRSAELGAPRVRIVVPCDWQRAGRSYFDDTRFGPGADFQWWIDTRNFAGDASATATNLWDDWNLATADPSTQPPPP